MVTGELASLSALYLADETAWLEAMSAFAAARNAEEIDWANLSEYLSDMAKRDRREVASRLKVLMAHVLKWQYQPLRQSKSWVNTICDQQEELSDILDSRTLRNHAATILTEIYPRAVGSAARETELPRETFPADCPYTLDELLSPDFPPAHAATLTE